MGSGEWEVENQLPSHSPFPIPHSPLPIPHSLLQNSSTHSFLP